MLEVGNIVNVDEEAVERNGALNARDVVIDVEKNPVVNEAEDEVVE